MTTVNVSGKVGVITNSDIDSEEDVATIVVQGFEVLWLSFLVGVANLSAFKIQYRLTGDGDWFTVASASGDFTTPNSPVLKASSNLTAAAAGSSVHFLKLDTKGVHSVRIRAAGTSSTLDGHFSMG